MLADGRAYANQPVAVFDLFQNIGGGEILDAVGRRIAQWFQQLGRDQRRDVMRLAVQHPRRLLRREAGRQLPQQRQKLMLVVAHINQVCHRPSAGDLPPSHLGIGILQGALAGDRRGGRSAPPDTGHRPRNPGKFDTRHNSFGVLSVHPLADCRESL